MIAVAAGAGWLLQPVSR